MLRKSPLHLERAVMGWARLRGTPSRLEQSVELTLKALPENLRPVAKKCAFTLKLTSDTDVRRLNHDFRGINKATNVLSFPHLTRRELIKHKPTKEPLYIGDIAIAYEYVVKEAKAEDKILLDHVTHLAIHGVLHLFGYDHQTDGTATRMERLERKIMAAMGLPDPYAKT